MADEVYSSPFPLDRWLKLAESKLAKDYVLHMETQRRRARFFKKGYGFEPCPYQAAQHLIESGRVVVEKRTAAEIRYIGVMDALPLDAKKIAPVDDVLDDEDESFSVEEDDAPPFESEDIDSPADDED